MFSIEYVSSTTATTGTVIANTAEEGCYRTQDRRTTCSTQYHPVVEITAASGERIRFTSEVGSDPARYGTGDSVPVRYRPHDPHDATIDGFVELWMLPTIVGGIGLVFLAVGIGLPISQFRQPRKHEAVEDTDVPTWGLDRGSRSSESE
ncbi:DUF3592 domain-containing protein [Microlunatus sp. GCM10028923]|uniref:DUF3592 domain-containing protein n=1 Tax=Microlunatus sp. GCM10028923 TaxID=3273400 RepID=UPI003617FD43